MEIPSPKVIKLKSIDDQVRLHATGDWHLGNRGCAEGHLRRTIAQIGKERNSAVLLMGDLGDFIGPSDKRWEPAAISEKLGLEDLEDWGTTLERWVSDVAKPIKGKIIGVLEGNHEATYSRQNHQAITQHIAGDLGCPELGYTSLIRIVFEAKDGSRDMTIMATHGSGGARTEGGKLNRLIATMQIAKADLVLMGHVHTCLMHRDPRLIRIDPDGAPAELGETSTMGVVTGTYLRTYCHGHSGYGERAGYKPTPIGHPVIVITPRTLEMTVGWV